MKRILLIITLCILFTTFIFGQKSKFVEVDNIKLHYLEWGNGSETILLIHGLYDSAEDWKAFAPLIAQKYKVIAPDRRGAGLSEKTLNGFDIETLAGDLEKLSTKLNIKKFHLIGHSAGGNAAMTFAAMFPEKVKSLILLEGGYWKKRKPGEIQECPKPIEKQCLISKEATKENYKYDAEKIYRKISSPTLLVLAIPNILDKAPEGTKKMFEQIKQEVKFIAEEKFNRGNFITIEDSGHWIHKDQPKKLSNIILKFYEELK